MTRSNLQDDMTDAKGRMTLHLEHAVLRAQVGPRRRTRRERLRQPERPVLARRRRAGRQRLLAALERIRLDAEIRDTMNELVEIGHVIPVGEGWQLRPGLDRVLADALEALWSLTSDGRYVQAGTVAYKVSRAADGWRRDGVWMSHRLASLADLGLCERRHRASSSGPTYEYRWLAPHERHLNDASPAEAGPTRHRTVKGKPIG